MQEERRDLRSCVMSRASEAHVVGVGHAVLLRRGEHARPTRAAGRPSGHVAARRMRIGRAAVEAATVLRCRRVGGCRIVVCGHGVSSSWTGTTPGRSSSMRTTLAVTASRRASAEPHRPASSSGRRRRAPGLVPQNGSRARARRPYRVCHAPRPHAPARPARCSRWSPRPCSALLGVVEARADTEFRAHLVAAGGRRGSGSRLSFLVAGPVPPRRGRRWWPASTRSAPCSARPAPAAPA